MLRKSSMGALAFGLSAALAGWLWSAYDFPFAMLLPAALGWFVVTRSEMSLRGSILAALLGGVSFTAVLMVGMFFALTDGSPFAISAWASAGAAAALAGAVTGWMLGRIRGSLVMAGFSAGGMLIATLAAGLIRSAASASVDVPGVAQNMYLAGTMGIIGLIVGAAVGLGVSWLALSASGSGAAL